MSSTRKSSATIVEMKEFAGFSASTQRYIRRSMDVAEGREDVIGIWARDTCEESQIRAQWRMYGCLTDIRDNVPDDVNILSAQAMMSHLIVIAAFDLGQGRLPTFSAFRFLYERLISGRVRPWLPSAFMAGAGMPSIEPSLRGSLLKSLSEAAATAHGWNARDAVFFPSWVEKVGA